MLTTIAFDADDTLWRNNSHFTITETTFANLLQEYSQTKDLNKQLLETEKQNLNYYGYGAKGYTLSMIETAIQVTQGRVPTTIISQLLDSAENSLDIQLNYIQALKKSCTNYKANIESF